MNEYTAISDYYDLLMNSGYYQYNKLYDKSLADGIIYSQEIVESKNNKNCIEKNFYFKKGDQVVAHQKLIYRIFKGQEIEDIFSKAGFKLKEKDKTGQLLMYNK